jgi:hypothetical protein
MPTNAAGYKEECDAWWAWEDCLTACLVEAPATQEYTQYANLQNQTFYLFSNKDKFEKNSLFLG